MTALAIVIVILLLLTFARLGVCVEYSEEGMFVSVFAGLIKIRILPRPEKVEKPVGEKKKKEKKTKKSGGKKKGKKSVEKPSGEQPVKKGGSMALIRDLVPGVLEVLRRFKHRLLINRLVIYYTSAGDDPYSTAMNFGYVSAGMGILTPFFENNFRIRRRDFRASFDFEAPEPYVYINLKLSIAIWEIVYAALGINLRRILPHFLGKKKNASNNSNRQSDRKVEKSNG